MKAIKTVKWAFRFPVRIIFFRKITVESMYRKERHVYVVNGAEYQ